MLDDLVSGDDAIFSATGVSAGELLDGVKFLGGDLAETYSHRNALQNKNSTIH